MDTYVSPEDYISPSELADMEADDKLPIVGYWVGLVFHWYPQKLVGTTLRHFTAGPTTAAVSPDVVALGHKIMRTGTSMFWQQTGSLYFEWRERRLFMAFEAGGEYRSVPEWTLLLLQDLPESIQDLQSPKPLYLAVPGKKRKRKATQGETEMAIMVGLRRSRKTWDDIRIILGDISKKVMDERIQEIESIFPDIQKMGNRGTIRPKDCERLSPAWIRHNEPGSHRRKRPVKH